MQGMSASGTSRHSAARRNLVVIGAWQTWIMPNKSLRKRLTPPIRKSRRGSTATAFPLYPRWRTLTIPGLTSVS